MGRQAEIAALAEWFFLKHTPALEPRNPRWHGTLAQFYAVRAESATGERRTTYIRKAMDKFNAEALIGPDSAAWLKARRSNSRIRPFRVNLILGGVALRRGDLKRAGECLPTAAQVGDTQSAGLCWRSDSATWCSKFPAVREILVLRPRPGWCAGPNRSRRAKFLSSAHLAASERKIHSLSRNRSASCLE